MYKCLVSGRRRVGGGGERARGRAGRRGGRHVRRHRPGHARAARALVPRRRRAARRRAQSK